MAELHPTPGKDEIALLDKFERLELNQIQVVATAGQATQALAENAPALFGASARSQATAAFARAEAALLSPGDQDSLARRAAWVAQH